MYKLSDKSQSSFLDFNQPMGLLSEDLLDVLEVFWMIFFRNSECQKVILMGNLIDIF